MVLWPYGDFSSTLKENSNKGDLPMKIKPMEIAVMRYARGCLEAFLRNSKNLNWIKGVIRSSGVLYYGGMLQEIFDGLRRYESLPRYQEILKECRKEGWL